jgi:hypothetical protein
MMATVMINQFDHHYYDDDDDDDDDMRARCVEYDSSLCTKIRICLAY